MNRLLKEMLMKTLISQEDIGRRISEMANEIDSYYMRTSEPIIVIGVLTGALFFMVDLVRQLSIGVELGFIGASTYPGGFMTAQETKIITEHYPSLHNRRILLVDDILDRGNTLDKIKDRIVEKSPNNIRTAVLLRKPGEVRKCKDVDADFVGFDIPDEFVFGYGMDYCGRYREMPHVAVWSKDECRTS
jgi:hypoxanthine phosphoribosyltransferase